MPARFDRCHSELRRDAVAIFLFHGVIPRQVHRVRNYTKKHLVADEFEACLRNLAEHGKALSMSEALAIFAGAAPLAPNSFVITFDDGFENNLTVAAPLLRKYRIPAMFYVCSSFVEENRASWTDQLEHAFEHAPGAVQEKIAALDKMRSYVKSNPDVDPYEYARSVIGAAGAPDDRWLDQKLSWAQVRELDQDELFDVGAHGHSHRILAYLPEEELRFEVEKSIALLGRAIGRAPEHFSYPEGLAHCYSERVIRELKARGIRCSPTAIEGVNPVGSDPFHLRRIFVV